MVKNLPVRQETRVQSLGGEVPLEKGMAIHSSILAWTEKPGRLQSVGSQRVGHDWVTNTTHRIKILVFLRSEAELTSALHCFSWKMLPRRSAWDEAVLTLEFRWLPSNAGLYLPVCMGDQGALGKELLGRGRGEIKRGCDGSHQPESESSNWKGVLILDIDHGRHSGCLLVQSPWNDSWMLGGVQG